MWQVSEAICHKTTNKSRVKCKIKYYKETMLQASSIFLHDATSGYAYVL